MGFIKALPKLIGPPIHHALGTTPLGEAFHRESLARLRPGGWQGAMPGRHRTVRNRAKQPANFVGDFEDAIDWSVSMSSHLRNQCSIAPGSRDDPSRAREEAAARDAAKLP